MKVVLYLFFLLSILFFGCIQSESTYSTDFGFNSEDDSSRIVRLEIENFSSFDTLYQSIQSIVCNDSIPAFVLKSDNRIKILKLYSPCWKNVGCILIQMNNVFRIIDNKILFDKEYELSLLDSLMKVHYLNYGKSPFHSNDPSRVIISITYREEDLQNLEILLDRITDSFEKLKIQVPIKIQLDRIIPPPPPL